MSIQAHIDNWKKAVATWQYTPWPETITTDDLKIYRFWCNELNKAAISARDKNYMVTVKGIDKPKGGGKSMYIRHDVHTLKIAYVPRPRQQAVTETSKAAFHALERTSLQGRIAELIGERSVGGGNVTRKEIAAALDLETSTVSARVNELLSLPGFHLNGQKCKIVITGERVSNVPGAKMKNEALRLELWQEEKAVQAALF